jgi:hypothetical protein
MHACMHNLASFADLELRHRTNLDSDNIIRMSLLVGATVHTSLWVRLDSLVFYGVHTVL